MKSIKTKLWIPIIALALSGSVFAQTSAKNKRILDKIVTIPYVIERVTTLASDEMEGRLIGTDGIEKAATYIEENFKKIGLKPFDGKTFRQQFVAKDIPMENIIGVLEGKTKKNEFVIYSAHYDHIGYIGGEGKEHIANGADDNASGVTALFGLAEYFKKVGNERTIIFVAFSGEESGLLGSKHYAETIDADKIIAGINIEMIGKISSFGVKSAFLTGFERSSLGEIIQENLKGTEYNLHPDPYKRFKLFYRSDNAPLAKKGVPAHTFSTDAIDKDKHYHQVTDEVETLNMENLMHAIKLIAIGTEEIVNGKDTPTRVK
ncbi:M20/M25/M40 family metallo-hydrolase [Aureivirga marina]|uniref:M20/M25/M40 family metallo-hydrolase n=1 Tax=Aureivirga marina TaxID=1182451 RepID=UPI0018CAA738|nr:M28 family peptidase [Aureivirga marina]